MKLNRAFESDSAHEHVLVTWSRLRRLLTILVEKWTGQMLAGSLLIASVNAAQAANWYVRPSAAGANNGTDWNNAWSVSSLNWNSVSPGDTVWMAGGNYSGSINFGKSGTSSSRIYVKRVKSSDAVPAAAPGWSTSFASQAVFSGFPNPVTVNYVTFDGQDKDGFYFTVPQGDTHDFIFSQNTGFVLSHAKFKGPGWLAVGSFAVWFYACSNCTMSYCTVDGVMQQISLNGATGCIIEHCTLLNCGPAGNPSYHPDVVYGDHAVNLIFRFNTVSNCQSECLFFDNGGSSGEFYGNVMIMGANGSGNAIQPKQGYSWGAFTVYNNTFVDWSPACLWRGSMSPAPVMKNNLFWHTSWQQYSDYSGTSPTSQYNGYSGANQDSAGGYSSSTDPFVDSAHGDYHLKPGSWPINRGTSLGSTYAADANGNTRGADGAWDMGAFEYGSVSTNPVISVSPAILTFGSVLSGKSVTNFFTVQNTGGGTLSGSASLNGASSSFSIVSGQAYSLAAGQSTQVGIRYSPVSSADSATFTFSGGGQGTAMASGSLAAVLSGLSFPSYAGIITAPFGTNGGYVSQAIDVSNDGQTGVANGGHAVYTFNVVTQGNYVVTASVSAPNASAKSFWVNMDAEPTDPMMIWDVYPYTSGFESRTISWRGNGTATADQYIPQVFSLTAGFHQLIVVGREAGVQLGQITIAPYSASHPNLPSAPQNLRVVASQ